MTNTPRLGLRRQRGLLGLAAAALIFGLGVPALGTAYLLGKMTQQQRQALEETSRHLEQGGTWSAAQQQAARTANRDVAQTGAGGSAVVLGNNADGVPDRAAATALVAAAATSPVAERSGADTPAPTQSAPLPPDALRLGPCTPATLAYCETRSACAAAGGHWWGDDTCNRQPQPECKAGQWQYCYEEKTCEAVRGHWINGQCTRSGCWQYIDTERQEAPVPRGYAGGSTTVHGLINMDQHPSDPNWSHLITATYFRWTFDGGDPVDGRPGVVCEGEALSGTASMSNTGNQLGRAGYSPNAYLSLVRGVAASPVWALHSTELPAPGETVTRPFSIVMPPGKEGDIVKLEASAYVGRANFYRYVFKKQPGSFAATQAQRGR